MRDTLIREWFDRIADGSPEGRASLLAQVPAEIRSDVAELLAHLDDTDADFLKSPIIRESPTSFPEKIDRYRILRVLGTGGMGVVYEAEQDYPQRLVALKLIRPGIVSPTAVKRFHLEATILGKLRHPGIAQVYDAGVASTGQPYFAMELVRGQPIEDIAGQWTRTELLELFAQICDAVDHAHGQGVIHRDLKPSNILIDERRQPKVLDFGVARSEEIEVSQAYTSTGELVGTLAYMSPEQFAGPNTKIDRRADIHALGVILYRLLAGRPPYDLDRQPLTEIARIIRNVDPIPLGRWDPRLRGDLETIVGKALEKAPERRYATANDLARDIRLHLSDEPIQARPPSAIYRMRKYVRRHRMSVALTTVLALGLIATSFASWRAMKAERATGRALKEIEAEQKKTLAALEESTRARERTRTALYALTDEVIERSLARRERLGPSEQEFLKQILRFIEESAADEGDNPAARLMRATGLRRVGAVQTALGDCASATKVFQTAVELLEKLHQEYPQEPLYQLNLVRVWNKLAIVFESSGNLAEAERFHRRALEMQDKLTSQQPNVAHAWNDKVDCLLQLGTNLTLQGQNTEAEKIVRTAIVTVEESVQKWPNEGLLQKSMGLAYDSLGVVLNNQNRFQEAVAAKQRALAEHEKSLATAPSDLKSRRKVALTASNLGFSLQSLKRYSEAETVLNRALEISSQIAAEFPSLPSGRSSLATVFDTIGILNVEREDWNKAESAFQRAEAIHATLTSEFPDVLDYATAAVATTVNRGMIAARRNQREAALELFTQGIAKLERLAEKDKANATIRRYLKNALWGRANILEQLKRPVEAIPDWTKSINYVAPAERGNPRTRLAGALLLAGQFQRAADEASSLATDPQTDPERSFMLAWVLAGCALATTDESEANKWNDLAALLIQRAHDAGTFREPTMLRQLKTDAKFVELRKRAEVVKIIDSSPQD